MQSKMIWSKMLFASRKMRGSSIRIEASFRRSIIFIISTTWAITTDWRRCRMTSATSLRRWFARVAKTSLPKTISTRCSWLQSLILIAKRTTLMQSGELFTIISSEKTKNLIPAYRMNGKNMLEPKDSILRLMITRFSQPKKWASSLTRSIRKLLAV